MTSKTSSGDLSSISGSESDSEDSEETVKTTPTDSTHQSSSSPFVHFSASDSEALYSVYRVILTGGKVRVSECVRDSIIIMAVTGVQVE